MDSENVVTGTSSGNTAGANRFIVKASPTEVITQANVFSGCVWDFGGWIAVDDQSITNISYCLVEESGNEHWTTLTKDGSGANTWCEDISITSYAQTTIGYGTSSVGYRLYANDDLSSYTDQTVTLSVRNITSGGRAVTLLATTVSVP